MLSQNDVTSGFSQNIMPIAKRSRANSYGRSTKRGRYSKTGYKTKTTQIMRSWPYASFNQQLFDPFPAKMRCLMRYKETVNIGSTLGVPGAYLFRANSIFDPNATGGGHQPYGHDTYANIYNHYNVRNATITMRPIRIPDGVVFGISLTDDASVQGTYDTFCETKNTRMSVADEGTPRNAVIMKFNVNSNFDVPYQKATSAQFGATPSEQMFFHCWVEGRNSDASSGTCDFLVTISYEVDMWELKDLGQS